MFSDISDIFTGTVLEVLGEKILEDEALIDKLGAQKRGTSVSVKHEKKLFL